MYNERVLDHFSHPRNVGEVENADGVGRVGNPTCGDIMELSIKVKDDHIEDVKFKTFGCGAAIATSSMVTEMVKGKTLEEAMEVSNRAVAEALGGLPPTKMHCSNLAADALHLAINDYLEKKGLPPMGKYHGQSTEVHDEDGDEHGHDAHGHAHSAQEEEGE